MSVNGVADSTIGFAGGADRAAQPPSPYASLGLPANASASDVYAALTQEQWNTYVQTFVPIENQLISYATDQSQPLKEAQAASGLVGDQFAQAGGNEQRRLQSLGITLSPQEAAASARQTDNDRSLALVQGQNLAMDLTRQRQMGILGNPTPTTGSIAAQATSLQV